MTFHSLSKLGLMSFRQWTVYKGSMEFLWSSFGRRSGQRREKVGRASGERRENNTVF